MNETKYTIEEGYGGLVCYKNDILIYSYSRGSLPGFKHKIFHEECDSSVYASLIKDHKCIGCGAKIPAFIELAFKLETTC